MNWIEGLIKNLEISIQNIMNNSENSLLVATEMLSGWIDICDIIKTKSDNESFNFIIEDLKNDMTYFSEKSKSEILL
jgi:hypothetical protein